MSGEVSCQSGGINMSPPTHTVSQSYENLQQPQPLSNSQLSRPPEAIPTMISTHQPQVAVESMPQYTYMKTVPHTSTATEIVSTLCEAVSEPATSASLTVPGPLPQPITLSVPSSMEPAPMIHTVSEHSEQIQQPVPAEFEATSQMIEIDTVIEQPRPDQLAGLVQSTILANTQPQEPVSPVGFEEAVSGLEAAISYLQAYPEIQADYVATLQAVRECIACHGKILRSMTKAKKSLPNILSFRPSSIQGVGDGVYSGAFIPVGVIFGPYEGEIIQNPALLADTSYCWDVHEGGNLYVDGHDETKSNWMRFVRCVGNPPHHNLEPFLYDNKLYFHAARDIQPGVELLLPLEHPLKYSLYTKGVKPTSTQWKTSSGPIPCTQCSLRFTSKRGMMRHMRVHSGESAYTCSMCGKGFSRNIRLQEHMRVHTGERPFKCDVCNKTFLTELYLSRHAKLHRPDELHKCNLCDKAYAQPTSLRIHMMTHTGQKPFKCDQCQKTFIRRFSLQQHLKFHNTDRPFTCTSCFKGFTRLIDLKYHEHQHSQEKPHACETCAKMFSTPQKLKVHQRSHSGEKNYQCSTCSKFFKSSSSLSVHKQTHVTVKSNECRICQKMFSLKRYLHEHIRRTHGKFKCGLCETILETHSELRDHMKTH